MGFLSFCLVSVLQMGLFLALFYYFAKWKLEFSRKVRELAGVERNNKISLGVGLVFVGFMASFVLMMYEMSTLVLNKGVFVKVVVVFFILFAVAEAIVRKLTVFKEYLLPSENPKYFEFVLTACLAFFTLSIAIETNFILNPRMTSVDGVVSTVKPARMGSPVMSVKVQVPGVPENGWLEGISFFRYHTEKNSLSVGEAQKINLQVSSGSLGLLRAKASEPHEFLKGNMFGF